jgi:molecular chaperone GrpE
MAPRHRDDEKERVHKVKVNHDDEQPEEMNQEEMAVDQLASEIQSLQEELEQLRKDAEESRDHYVRVLADFDNFRKRQRDEVARRIAIAREELLIKLLPIIDNFQRALQSAEAQHSYESLVEGVSMTLRQVLDMLQKEGVQPIEAVGQQFNPELHEAVARVETDEHPENTIIDEYERGYTIDGRVLRPSRVRVAVAPE